ncbi:2'-5' RNA ligase family protein [Cecembia sp.]|uniref:2'-5' RNA ligase family protein n=1 Tax=Cecembia sp. TaxID=1898110 RepID=UPI0025BC2028|nr:2'-5' RNA ligase family protein [Cecembia sp.]
MATELAKYFLALVPQGQIQKEATAMKEELKLLFNLKYALKSPAHVTVKMPFNYNELKEERLISKMQNFLSLYPTFHLELKGFDRFGKRVIFIHVRPSAVLNQLQENLGKFCKLELKLNNELSDRAFHPHMTLAFKDIKPNKFESYWQHIKSKEFQATYAVEDLALLKRIGGRWEVIHRFILKG